MSQELITILLVDAIEFHEVLTREYHNLDGIRDIHLLESAISNPFQSMFGKDLYSTIPEKAAALSFGIINNHPFVDGNKRTGLHSMLVFLFLNHFELIYSQPEIEILAVKIAEKKMSITAITEWIESHHFAILLYDDTDW